MRTLKYLFVGGLAMGIATGARAAEAWKNQAGTYAVLETSVGKIICVLHTGKSPETSANFIGLAEGTKEFTDTKTGKATKGRFYDDGVFHRVIPGFMIQGGDPLGTGYGGPGYKFKDEYPEGVKFDRAGVLAMANSGPNTNGSQFFITVAATPFLDTNGHYVIFGQVVEGQDVADAVSKVKRDPNNRPLTPVVITSVKIVRVGRRSP